MIQHLQATVTETLGQPPGHATISIVDLALPSDASISFTINRGQDSGGILGPHGWQNATNWLSPAGAEISEDRVEIFLNPAVTRYLTAGLNIELLISIDGRNELARAVIAWPNIDSGVGGGGLRSRRLKSSGMGDKPPPVEKSREPALPEPEDQTEAETPTEEKKTRTLLIVGGALVLLLVLGGGYFFYFQDSDDTWDRTRVAEYLSTNPGADQAYIQAEKLRTGRQADLAFIIYRVVARRGHTPSSMMVGAFYDPGLWKEFKSPLMKPDPQEAMDWYEGPAKNGDLVAQRRLGLLLLETETDDVSKQEQGIEWLRKAVEGGDKEAAEHLKKLSK